jgi:hypothetical protein
MDCQGLIRKMMQHVSSTFLQVAEQFSRQLKMELRLEWSL